MKNIIFSKNIFLQSVSYEKINFFILIKIEKIYIYKKDDFQIFKAIYQKFLMYEK